MKLETEHKRKDLLFEILLRETRDHCIESCHLYSHKAKLCIVRFFSEWKVDCSVTFKLITPLFLFVLTPIFF